MAGKTYKDLVVWRKAMQLVTDTYKLTEHFPRSEMFGLCSQLRRAVISVPSNIAEGQGRDSVKEFLHHLSISYGSLTEPETQIQIAANLTYIDQNDADGLLQKCDEVGRLLNGLLRSLRKDGQPTTGN
jgi:four helix bundle protein